MICCRLAAYMCYQEGLELTAELRSNVIFFISY